MNKKFWKEQATKCRKTISWVHRKTKKNKRNVTINNEYTRKTTQQEEVIMYKTIEHTVEVNLISKSLHEIERKCSSQYHVFVMQQRMNTKIIKNWT